VIQHQKAKTAAKARAEPARRVAALSFITLNPIEPFPPMLVIWYLKPHIPVV